MKDLEYIQQSRVGFFFQDTHCRDHKSLQLFLGTHIGYTEDIFEHVTMLPRPVAGCIFVACKACRYMLLCATTRLARFDLFKLFFPKFLWSALKVDSEVHQTILRFLTLDLLRPRSFSAISFPSFTYSGRSCFPHESYHRHRRVVDEGNPPPPPPIPLRLQSGSQLWVCRRIQTSLQ